VNQSKTFSNQDVIKSFSNQDVIINSACKLKQKGATNAIRTKSEEQNIPQCRVKLKLESEEETTIPEKFTQKS
jgi:hypothetical protein